MILTRSVLYIRLFGLMGSDLPFSTVCWPFYVLQGIKIQKWWAEREREREIYMFAISYLRAHSTKTNKSVKAKGNNNKKKPQRRRRRRSSRRNSWSSWWKEKRTFNVDYVRHKTKQTFRLSCDDDDETKVENMQNMQKSFALLSIFIPCQRVYTINRKSLKLTEKRTTIGRK